MPQAFDIYSADTTALLNELPRAYSRLKQRQAEVDEEREFITRLLTRLGQVVGSPEKSPEQFVRQIEANLKRSASRVIRDKKQQERTQEDAEKAARDRAFIIANNYGLPSLPDSILAYIKAKATAAYRVRGSQSKRP
ncbi:MAG TPA: hypothetical protein VN893_22490 [Bryobacteraceae bacterium]|nr:hypothetical protein [Bryobacteraceae bacterium]